MIKRGRSPASVLSAFAARKTTVVVASLSKLEVGDVMNGFAAAAATWLFAVRASHKLMLARTTEPSAKPI